MARVDLVADGICRISTMAVEYQIRMNQFLIVDERPALIHTGRCPLYADVRQAVGEILDPAQLECVIVLHFESDEYGSLSLKHHKQFWSVAKSTLPAGIILAP